FDILSLPSSAMRPPPSISTLFPYTTLFRSSNVPLNPKPPINPASKPATKKFALISLNDQPNLNIPKTLKQIVLTSKIKHIICLLDRKSTRLNSSHVSISYAVFCLKKKILKKIKHADKSLLSSPNFAHRQEPVAYICLL